MCQKVKLLGFSATESCVDISKVAVFAPSRGPQSSLGTQTEAVWLSRPGWDQRPGGGDTPTQELL